MSLRNTDVRTPGAPEIAKKWNLPLSKVYGLISQGAKVEFEHNRDKEKAKQIARDHINERPDYYKKLKNMERLPIRMKEGLSTEPERDSETIGDYTGASRKVMKVDEVNLDQIKDMAKKIPPKVKKAAKVGMTLANLATLGQVAGDAAEGRKGADPKRGIVAATSALPGAVGWGATGLHYTIKGYDKAKEHIRARQMEEEQINELEAETLGSYIKKSAASRKKSLEGPKPDIKTWAKREHGIRTAIKKLTKEETKMDTKDLINEALDDILENNLVSMKENLMTALQEKAMEKLEEKKREIASNYFAQ